MRTRVLSRVEKGRISDIHLRLDVLEQRGQFFRNPVNSFLATNGPANLGVRITFRLYLNRGIEAVEILRNTARDYASASVLQTYAVSTLTLNKPVTYYDHDKDLVGLTVYYWIRVIPKPSKFAPIVQGPQIVIVPINGDSSLLPPLSVANATNFATVDSIDAGLSATIRIYGAAGGVGTSWQRQNGYGKLQAFPSGTLVGQAYATTFYVMRITTPGGGYVALTALPDTLIDSYIFVGKVTTVASGGAGGVSGGGGVNGGPGGKYSTV